MRPLASVVEDLRLEFTIILNANYDTTATILLMAKGNTIKGISKVPNKTLHSRVSYLYQAAVYLANCAACPESKPHEKTPIADAQSSTVDGTHTTSTGLIHPSSRRLVSGLRAVSLKSQVRMSPAIKDSICKKCDAMLMDGSTCTKSIENKSKESKKPWADVLVSRCNTCGYEKRVPLAEKRQKRRPHRRQTSEPGTAVPRVENT